MKSDFITRKTFFRRPSDDRIDVKRPVVIERQRLSDNRGTNTLTYSDTAQDGPKGSDQQTVFKFTDRYSKGDEDDHAGELPEVVNGLGSNSKVRHSVPNQLTKSQQLNGRGSLDDQKADGNSVTKSNFLDSKVAQTQQHHEGTDDAQDLSENVGERELREIFERKQKLIPEYRCSWFQFFTEAIYCNVSSLSFVKSGIAYDVPFSIAKIVLRTDSKLRNFLGHCDLDTNIGTLLFDFQNLEEIRVAEDKDQQVFETDFIEVKGERVYIEYPLARVWDRYAKKWTHKLLDLEELESIDPQLTTLDLVKFVHKET